MLEIVRPRCAIKEGQELLQADLIRLASPGERGKITVGRLFLLLLLAAVIYIGTQVVSAYVDYLALRETVRATLTEIASTPHRAGEGNVRILEKARELRLPLTEQQVALRVDGGKVLASFRWQRPIGLWSYTIPLTFEIEESRSLR